jgi:hypothetical protein
MRTDAPLRVDTLSTEPDPVAEHPGRWLGVAGCVVSTTVQCSRTGCVVTTAFVPAITCCRRTRAKTCSCRRDQGRRSLAGSATCFHDLHSHAPLCYEPAHLGSRPVQSLGMGRGATPCSAQPPPKEVVE